MKSAFQLALLMWLTLGSCVAETWAQQKKLTISRETTWLIEPLDDEGYVDYLAAVKKELNGELKPEENAYVAMIRILGPRKIYRGDKEKYFADLGIQPFETTKPKSLRFDDPDFLDTRCERPWNKESNPQADAWLKQNQKTFEAVVKASECKGFYSPVVAEFKFSSAISGRPFVIDRDILNLIAAVRMEAIGSQNQDRFIQASICLRRLSGLYGQSRSPESFLGRLAAQAVNNYDQIHLMQADAMTPKQWSRYRKQYEDSKLKTDLRECFGFGERIRLVEYVQQLAQGNSCNLALDKKEKRVINEAMKKNADWDKIGIRINQYFNRLDRKVLRIQDPLSRLNAFKQVFGTATDWDERAETTGQRLIKNEYEHSDAWNEDFADYLIFQMHAYAGYLLVADLRAETEEELTRIAMAICHYRSEQGETPEKLEDLIPDYLQSIGKDGFSGAAYRYRRSEEGFCIYSFGDNRKDDGGRKPKENQRAKDLVFDIRFKKAVKPPAR